MARHLKSSPRRQLAEAGLFVSRTCRSPAASRMRTEDLTTMMEAEHSFKFNAVVFTTAADMLQSLYDAAVD